MAEFVTRRENIRRWIVIILCLLLTITFVILTFTTGSDAEIVERGSYDEDKKKTSKEPTKENNYEGDIFALTQILMERKEEFRSYIPPLMRYPEAIGSHHKELGTHDPKAPSELNLNNLKDFLNSWVDELAKRGKTQFTKWKIGEPAEAPKDGQAPQGQRARLTVAQLFGELKEIRDKIVAEAKTINEDTKKKNEEAKELDKKLKEELEKWDKELKEKIKQIADPGNPDNKMNVIRKKQNDYAAELEKLNKEFGDLHAELERVLRINFHEIVQLRDKEKEVSKRKTLVTHNMSEERERMDEDGRVLHVDNERQIAYVNLTLKEKVFIGNIFRVYGMQRGGVKYPKGELEIIDVDHEMAKAKVLRNDSKFPMTKDDFIWDEEYRRGMRRTFSFAGDLIGKYSREDLALLLRKGGDEYHEEVIFNETQQTNYLVIGDKFENDPNYATGSKVHIRVIKEKDLYHYLGIPWGLRRK